MMRMDRALRRGLSILLAQVMVFTSVDLPAFAATADTARVRNEAQTVDDAQLKEELRTMVKDEDHPDGVFGLAHTVFTLSEGEDGEISVASYRTGSDTWPGKRTQV